MNQSISRIDGVIEDPAIRFRDLQDRLRQTVRVGIDDYLSWGSPKAVPEPTVRGIDVPHEAANIPCGADIGIKVSDGVIWHQHCKKRVGHETPKGEKAHVALDYRVVATPNRVVHTERFKPNTLPAGIDMTITVPHDCANHLGDVSAMEQEAFRRGR